MEQTKSVKLKRWNEQQVGEVTKEKEGRENTEERKGRRLESLYTVSCIPTVPALPSTAFQSADMHRLWEMSTVLPACFCLAMVCAFSWQPAGNCFFTLLYWNSGCHCLHHHCPFLSYSQLFLPLSSFLLFPSSPVFPCSTASIHNSSTALIKDCLEDGSTASQAKLEHEADSTNLS